MDIWFKRGMWRVRDEMGRRHKFSSEQEAKAFVEGTSINIIPDTPEYESLEEAIADQDTDDLDLYEEELIAEED